MQHPEQSLPQVPSNPNILISPVIAAIKGTGGPGGDAPNAPVTQAQQVKNQVRKLVEY